MLCKLYASCNDPLLKKTVKQLSRTPLMLKTTLPGFYAPHEVRRACRRTWRRRARNWSDSCHAFLCVDPAYTQNLYPLDTVLARFWRRACLFRRKRNASAFGDGSIRFFSRVLARAAIFLFVFVPPPGQGFSHRSLAGRSLEVGLGSKKNL